MFCRQLCWNCLTLVAAAACCWFVCPTSYAQEKADQPGKPKSGAEQSDAASKPAADGKTAKEAYEEKLAQWKEVVTELRNLRAEFNEAEAGQTSEIRRRWDDALKRGNAMIRPLREAATAAYMLAPNKDRGLARFLVKMAADDVEHEHYEEAAELAQLLLENECGVVEIYDPAGIAAFATNDFDKAEQYLKQAESAGGLSETAEKLLPEVASYKGYWEREQELRREEAKKDDLPRVRLTTSKGDIVVELFENEAPGAVGNFISLVGSGFYKGLTFHRVLSGFMAQGGCPVGDGTGGPGYEIYCELDDEAKQRKHFRGSLSMAHAGPNTGGSQFFLTFLPTPPLNGKHTVFGRVIEGIEVLARIQRRDPDNPDPTRDPPLAEPDKIVKAEVIRKRDHEYAPNKVK